MKEQQIDDLINQAHYLGSYMFEAFDDFRIHEFSNANKKFNEAKRAFENLIDTLEDLKKNN